MADGNWNRVSRGNPCPVCEGIDKCAVSKNGDVARCARSEHFNGTKAFQYTEEPFPTWTHRLRPETAPAHRGSNLRIAPREESPPAVPAIDPIPVYKRFLELSPADQACREDCARRGIDPDALGYGAFPSARGRAPIIAALVERFGPELLTVPGFVESEPGRIDFAHQGFTKPAVVVPIRNRKGDPVCLRIRNPSPNITKNKWIYLSGGKNHDKTNGPSTRPTAHWARIPKALEAVVITEGERKADTIAARLPGMGVVSVPGAASWRIAGLIEDLEALEVVLVRIAYDSDLLNNKDVARGFLSLWAELESRGVGVEVGVWDKAHKGLDDALMAGVPVEFLAGDKAQAFRDELAKNHRMTAAGLPDNSPPDGLAPANRTTVYLDWDPVSIQRTAIDAVAADPGLFIREGKLVVLAGIDFAFDEKAKKEVTAKRAFQAVCNNRLAVHLDRSLTWLKQTKNGSTAASCPIFVASKVLVSVGKDDGPVPRSIFGITQGPTLDLAGNLINQDGYQRIGGLGWWMEGEVAGLADRLTDPGADPQEFAFDQLEALRKEGFPYIEWAGEDDWAKFLSFLFALILRPSLEKIPFHLISGNSPGCGKGILASAAHRIAYGGVMSSQTWPERADTRDEILGKEIINAVESGAAVFYFDDIAQGTQLASKELDKVIGGQGAGIVAREMRQNSGRSVGGKARMAFFGCGNNVSPNEDFGRRCVTIRIETRTPDPATRDPRTSFAGQGDLTRWFSQKENREKCLVFALNALRAYLVHLNKGGAEVLGKTLGGFYDYAKYCAGAVLFGTGIDPLAKMADEIRNTESAGGLAGLVTALDREGILSQDGRKASLIKDNIMKIGEHETREDLLSLFSSCGLRGKELTTRGVGQVIGKNKNKLILANGFIYKITAGTDRDGFTLFSLSKSPIGGDQ